MKFLLGLKYEDGTAEKFTQDSDSSFVKHIKTSEGWVRQYNPTINTQSVWWQEVPENSYRAGLIYGGGIVSPYVSASSNVTVSSVDTESRTITFHAPDGARQMPRAELERLYPRESAAVLRAAARTELERREAQRQADRARLEEERRNRPFWERVRNTFR